jgi:limonene-1,2-epoxide hydrolase
MPKLNRQLVLGFLAGAALVATLQSIAGQHTRQTETNPYREIPADVIAMIEAAEVPFMDQNADAIGEYLTEDFAWYQINAEGVKQAVKGRDATIALLSGFFGNSSWTESEVHRLGMLGNILVQVEVDTFMRDGAPTAMETLSVYEFREGKRWREWKFYPTAKTPL